MAWTKVLPGFGDRWLFDLGSPASSAKAESHPETYSSLSTQTQGLLPSLPSGHASIWANRMRQLRRLWWRQGRPPRRPSPARWVDCEPSDLVGGQRCTFHACLTSPIKSKRLIVHLVNNLSIEKQDLNILCLRHDIVFLNDVINGAKVEWRVGYWLFHCLSAHFLLIFSSFPV